MSEDTNTPQAEAPAFGIQDLIFTLQVYEAAAQRGAFRAEELSQVGALYDRLKTFLIANGALGTPAAPETTESSQGE